MRMELSKKEKKLLANLNLTRAQNARLAERWLRSDECKSSFSVCFFAYFSRFLTLSILAYFICQLTGLMPKVEALDSIAMFFVWSWCVFLPIVFFGLGAIGVSVIYNKTPEKYLDYPKVALLEKKLWISRLYSWGLAIALCGTLFAMGHFIAAALYLIGRYLFVVYTGSSRICVNKELAKIKDGPVEFDGARFIEAR